ncbi:hypothetical protein GCM10022238_02890 [Gordonia hankookensis]
MLPGIADERIPLIEHVLGVVELTWDGVLDVVEEFEDIASWNDAARSHRDASRFLDNRDEFVERFKNPVHSYPNPAYAFGLRMKQL